MNESSLNTSGQNLNSTEVERFIILGNGSCCGIFYQHKNDFIIPTSRIYILLSKYCEFIYIYYNNHEYKHKTRFIPMKFQPYVQKMIHFINSFVDEPYLTKRFINKSSLHYNNLAVNDNSHSLHHFINQYNWKGMLITTHSTRIGIFLCPMKQRICIVSNHYIKEDNTCIEIPVAGNMKDFELCAIAHLYAVSHLPLSQEQIIILLKLFDNTLYQVITESESYEQQVQEIIDILYTFHANTTHNHSKINNTSHNICNKFYSSAEAANSFNDLIPCLSLLCCNSDTYPSSSNATTSSNIYHYNDVLPMVEYLDGNIYMLTHLDIIDNRLISEVQCWSMSPTMPLNELVANIVEEYIEIIQTNKYVPQTCNTNSSTKIPNDVIISLKDDYFTIMQPSNPHSHHHLPPQQEEQEEIQVDTISFHHSYLQFEMNRRGGCYQGIPGEFEEDLKILVFPQDSAALEDISTEESMEKLNITTLVHLYYSQLVKLYKYREYLLSNHTILVHRYNYYKANQLKTIHGFLKDTMHKINDTILNPSIEPIHLTTNYGRFTAICKQCSLEESKLYQITTNLDNKSNSYDQQQHHIPSNHSTQQQLTIQCITTVRGVFKDHMILKFDIALQCFNILIPDGTEFSFTLQSYLNTSQECSYHNNHSIVFKEYIQKIISFYQWCLIPPGKRDIMTIHRENTSRIARASILNSHRYLLMQQILNKQLTSKEAYMKSCDFENHLAMDSNIITVEEKTKNKAQFSIETMKLLANSQAKRLHNKMNPMLYHNENSSDQKNTISNNNVLLVQEGLSHERVVLSPPSVTLSIPSATPSYSILTHDSPHSITKNSSSASTNSIRTINTSIKHISTTNAATTATVQNNLFNTSNTKITYPSRLHSIDYHLNHISYHKVTPPYNSLPLHTSSPSSSVIIPMKLAFTLREDSLPPNMMITPTSITSVVTSSERYQSTSKDAAMIQIQTQADQYAGNYIYENVSMNNASNKGNHTFEDANTGKDNNESLYSTSRINPTTAQYLKATYVQNALDHSKQVLLRNQEYLQYRSSSVPL